MMGRFLTFCLLLMPLVALSGAERQAADTSKAVPLADPYQLGERLVLIDYLREQGLTVEPGTGLAQLRDRFWALHPPPDVLTDEDIPDSEVLVLRLDVANRRISSLRQRLATLERELAGYQDLVRQKRELEQQLEDLQLRLQAALDLEGRFVQAQEAIAHLREENEQLRSADRAATAPPVVIAPRLPRPDPQQPGSVPAPIIVPAAPAQEPEQRSRSAPATGNTAPGWLHVLLGTALGAVVMLVWQKRRAAPEEGGWLARMPARPEVEATPVTLNDDDRRFAPPATPADPEHHPPGPERS